MARQRASKCYLSSNLKSGHESAHVMMDHHATLSWKHQSQSTSAMRIMHIGQMNLTVKRICLRSPTVHTKSVLRPLQPASFLRKNPCFI